MSNPTRSRERFAVTGRLSVPLYTNGGVEAQVRQAKQTHVSLLQGIEQARSEIQSQVSAAWAQLEAAKAQLESDRVSVEASRTALNGVREEEKVGQRTLLDVLNAEQELLNAEVNLVGNATHARGGILQHPVEHRPPDRRGTRRDLDRL